MRIKRFAKFRMSSNPAAAVAAVDELVDRFKRRYGPGGKADVFLAELRQRRRGPKETIQELGQTIRDLTALVYPDFDEDGQIDLQEGIF